MKKFDFKAALTGEPVRLRQGSKAYVVGKIPSNLTYKDNELIDYPLIGVVLDEIGYLTGTVVFWTINGKCSEDGVWRDADIIGMWEEPKISVEDLPKPFKPEENELYFYINNGCVCRNLFWSGFDENLAKNAQCFKTREDAQKWLDFMKSMTE